MGFQDCVILILIGSGWLYNQNSLAASGNDMEHIEAEIKWFHFADIIFKSIFYNKNYNILISISPVLERTGAISI